MGDSLAIVARWHGGTGGTGGMRIRVLRATMACCVAVSRLRLPWMVELRTKMAMNTWCMDGMNRNSRFTSIFSCSALWYKTGQKVL